MYYDPMISKLITWGKDRKEAMGLLADAMDQYVIRGVTHNVGFGQSILRNKDFAGGSYTTAFIPTYYPTGFTGDPLDSNDHQQLVLSAYYLKNLYESFAANKPASQSSNTLYVSIKGADHDTDFKVEPNAEGGYTVTDIQGK